MERRKFTREFKLEAVRLIKDRGYLTGKHRKTWEFIRRSFAIG